MNISSKAVRFLSLDDLGLSYLSEVPANNTSDGVSTTTPSSDTSELDANDWVLPLVRSARDLGFAGVILSGPPGTGKSWHAQQLAVSLTGDWENVRSVQFHPSYQYDDFVFGYQADSRGIYQPTAKEFARACSDAAAQVESKKLVVLVIDEISRSDVIRVFGEALTYLEMDKRGIRFRTANGEYLEVPENLFIIGTMNPWDKGVDELDAALERRFAQIDLLPDPDTLTKILLKNGSQQPFLDRLVGFFNNLQKEDNERVRLGHAYFLKCKDEETAQLIWQLRLHPTLRRACSLDISTLKRLETAWKIVVASDENANSSQTNVSSTNVP